MADEKYSGKWEHLSENTYRMKTPEGWIVKDIYTLICAGNNGSVDVASWRVLDPEHTWIITR